MGIIKKSTTIIIIYPSYNKAVTKGYLFFLNAPEIHTCSVTGKEDTPSSILYTNLLNLSLLLDNFL